MHIIIHRWPGKPPERTTVISLPTTNYLDVETHVDAMTLSAPGLEAIALTLKEARVLRRQLDAKIKEADE